MSGHPLQHWYQSVATLPAVLDIVGQLIGPNILVRNADVFIKAPQGASGIGWHVDSGRPHAHRMLTVWIGLSDSSTENGCMEFVPGSHRIEMEPRDNDSLNLTDRDLAQLAVDRAVPNVMDLGCASLHSFRTAHRSGPNLSTEARFGYAVRYIPADADPADAECGEAFLARGDASGCRFALRDTFAVGWRVLT